MSSTALSATRFGIAALAFAPYVWRGLKIPQVRRSAAELALWLFGGYTAQASGLEMTTAARGAFTGAESAGARGRHSTGVPAVSRKLHPDICDQRRCTCSGCIRRLMPCPLQAPSRLWRCRCWWASAAARWVLMWP
jgi:hypothetical protein